MARLSVTKRANLSSLKLVVQIDRLYIFRAAISEYALRGVAHVGLA